MKHMVLVLIMFFPVAMLAQENDPKIQGDQTTATASVQVGLSATNNGGSAYSEPNSSNGPAIGQDANAQQSQTGKSPQPSKPKGEVQRPVIEGSMVGYIDNAIVGSEIRVRFDAAFHDNAPDRAEFFYAQCGCNQRPGDNAPGPKPGLVADLNFQQLYLRGEYAPISRFSIFTEVPVRWIQPQAFVPNTGGTFPDHAGLSDVLAGVRFAALASSSRYLTFQFQASFPSGDASKGLGTNHYSIEPELLYYQKISDRAALEAMVGDTHPIGGSDANVNNVSTNFAGDVFFYGVGPSYVLYKGESVQFAPVIELVGWSVLGGLETNGAKLRSPIVSADGINIVNLKVGARTAIGAHSSIYIGYGHQLTHDVWYKEIVRVEYRYAF